MTEPVYITVKQAAINALTAHKEGRLGFQRKHRTCLYRYDDGACCAIGASIPDGHEIITSSNHRSVLILDDLLVTDDKYKLSQLQDAHDNLCGGHSTESAFLKLANELANET